MYIRESITKNPKTDATYKVHRLIEAVRTDKGFTVVGPVDGLTVLAPPTIIQIPKRLNWKKRAVFFS
jgi:hypothetical protein